MAFSVWIVLFSLDPRLDGLIAFYGARISGLVFALIFEDYVGHGEA